MCLCGPLPSSLPSSFLPSLPVGLPLTESFPCLCFLCPTPFFLITYHYPLLLSFLDLWTLLSRPTVCMYSSEARICIWGRGGLSDFSSLCCSTFVVYSIHTAQSVLTFRHHQLNSENRTPGSLKNALHVLLHKVKGFGIIGSTKDMKEEPVLQPGPMATTCSLFTRN